MPPKISELGKLIDRDLTGQATEELVDTIIEVIADRDEQIRSLRQALQSAIRSEHQLLNVLNETVEETDRYAEIIAKVWQTDPDLPAGLAEQVRAIAETDVEATQSEWFADDEVEFFEDWVDVIPEDPLLSEAVRVFRRWGFQLELRFDPK